MFEESAKLHFLCKCNVGGGSPEVQGKLYGMGCLLDQNHVLTARHVWSTIKPGYGWPVVLKHDGLYKCQVVFEDQDADLLVIRATEKVVACELTPPPKYPNLTVNAPFIGKTVGSMASLKVHGLDNEEGSTYFSMSSLSMFMSGTPGKALHIAMTGSLIQRGFSGGPVFEENGDILGVLIQSLRFPLDPSNPSVSFTTMPIMSAVFPYRAEIVSLLD